MPNYICGRVYRSIIDDTSSTNGGHEKEYDNGIVILEDMSSKGYHLVDPDLMLFDLDQMKVCSWNVTSEIQNIVIFVSNIQLSI